MVQLTRLFFSLCLVSVSFATPAKRTVAQVEADITSIGNQVKTLDTDLTGFPASGLAGALAIHTAASNLVTTVNTGTTDVKNTGTVSEADGNTILTQVQAIEPTILDALSQITAKQPSFAALPIGGIPALVLQDLKTLNTSTVAFAAALIVAAPADLRAQQRLLRTPFLRLSPRLLRRFLEAEGRPIPNNLPVVYQRRTIQLVTTTNGLVNGSGPRFRCFPTQVSNKL
ncbi:hydrophobic surface binding protein A-domain-containing protein [Mycena olivaceomarginata]|nr:hydrophobic surface binding protein A-domain-containing protein [Mycena olivaceomarginata]